MVCSWRSKDARLTFEQYSDLLAPDSDTPVSTSPPLSDPAWRRGRSCLRSRYFQHFWIIFGSFLDLRGTHRASSGRGHLGPPSCFLGLERSLLRVDADLHLAVPSLEPGPTRERFISTNDQGRIFALLGLPFAGNSPDADALLIKPIYHQSVQDIHVHAAPSVISQDQHLRLLSTLQNDSKLDGFYPPWAPN